MNRLKKLLRPLTPHFLLNGYHYLEAQFTAWRYGYPSEKLIVIGVTGSKGKTTTANMIWAALAADGSKVGQTGTANFRIGSREQLNPYHMTMPGPKVIQSLLRQMVNAGCRYAVIETPSEAQVQYRHIGINYDVLVFTNITHELVAAHNYSVERLRRDNSRVFARLARGRRKMVGGVRIPKLLVTNADSPDSELYSSFRADRKVTFGVKKSADFRASSIKTSKKGTDFQVGTDQFHLNLLGSINVINAVGAIATAHSLGVNTNIIQKGFSNLDSIPGRMEIIDAGQKFTVIVDYAHEQEGMKALMETAPTLIDKGSKIITHLGGQGGGRDVAKRAELGKITGGASDYVVVSDDDPYDDDPMEIIENIAEGAVKAGKKRGHDLFLVQDRRKGIRKALELAKRGDLVLITCKGADQLMMLTRGTSIPWDDRKVVREELAKILKKK